MFLIKSWKRTAKKEDSKMKFYVWKKLISMQIKSHFAYLSEKDEEMWNCVCFMNSAFINLFKFRVLSAYLK